MMEIGEKDSAMRSQMANMMTEHPRNDENVHAENEGKRHDGF